MDLTYLRENPDTIDRLLEHQRIRTTTVHVGVGGRAERLTLDDGTNLFAKTREDAPDDFFRVEAQCLDWLREAKATLIPEVIAATTNTLLLPWIEPADPTAPVAEKFGRDLAALHQAGASSFGAPWPGYIGSLTQDNTPAEQWAPFYAEQRCRPYVRQARDAGLFTREECAEVDQLLDRVPALAGPAEPPSRLHGDLWSGNVHYAADGHVWLIDAAAHGGHRETDLAQLTVFGAPFLDRIIAAYNEVSPLADGWRDRLPLHELQLLLVNAVLFGATYAARALNNVRALA
ncbi:MAG: phosphotransferase [Corynebacteriales bacterium]|nr:phosphotransferase [Mycobacteriales bacterium]